MHEEAEQMLGEADGGVLEALLLGHVEGGLVTREHGLAHLAQDGEEVDLQRGAQRDREGSVGRREGWVGNRKGGGRKNRLVFMEGGTAERPTWK